MYLLQLSRAYSPSEICCFEKRIKDNACIEIEHFFAEENNGLISLKDKHIENDVLYSMTWNTFLFIFLLGEPVEAKTTHPCVKHDKEVYCEHSMRQMSRSSGLLP